MVESGSGSHSDSRVRGSGTSEARRGSWEDNPPFHTPVFVLAIIPGPASIWPTPRSNASTLRPPRRCFRPGKPLRAGIGVGVATVREFLEADPIDTIHVAVAPIEIGPQSFECALSRCYRVTGSRGKAGPEFPDRRTRGSPKTRGPAKRWRWRESNPRPSDS